MKQFQNILDRLNRFINLGSENAISYSDALKIRIVNVFYIITVSTNIIMISLSLVKGDIKSIYIVSFCAVIETFLIVLNIKGYQKVSRYLISFGLFLLLVFFEVFSGSNWGIEYTILLFIFLAYILFSGKEQQLIIGFQVIVYLALPFISAIVPESWYFDFPEIPHIVELLFVIYVLASGSILTVYQLLVRNHRSLQSKTILALQDSNERLEQTKKQIEQFTYIVSNNIKSQLATVHHRTVQLQHNIEEAKFTEVKAQLKPLRNIFKEMYFWVNDILEHSSFDDDVEYQKTAVDLNQKMDKALQHFAVIHPTIKKHITIDTLPTVMANDKDIFIILYHLINVLWKHQLSNDLKITSTETATSTDIIFQHPKDNDAISLSYSDLKLEELILKKWNGTLHLTEKESVVIITLFFRK